MDVFFQILIVTIAALLTGTLVYLSRWRQQLLSSLSLEKKREANLRKELHAMNGKAANALETIAFLRDVLDTPTEALLVFPVGQDDELRTFQQANKAACSLLEYSAEELCKLLPTDIELIPEPGGPAVPLDVEHASIANSSQLATSSSYARNIIRQQLHAARQGHVAERETTFVTRDQHLLPILLRTYCLHRENGDLYVYSLRDLRGQQQARERTQMLERNYNELFQSSLVGLAIYDSQRRLQRANPACLRMFGTPSIEEMRQLELFHSPALPDKLREQINRGESMHGEVVFDFEKLINEKHFVTSRRRKVYFDVSFQNLGRDEHQNHRGYLVQFRDITDLRETETALSLRETQLLQSRKMEAIGMMTGGIAHDFNNILTPILGYSEISVDFCEDNPRLKEFIGEIRTATMRAKELVSQILVYSRQSDDDLSHIHLAPIVKEVAKQQSAVLAPHIEVSYALRSPEDLVLANPTQMHQILMNLSTNAAYAMRESGGKLDIQLSTFNMGWRLRQEFPQLKKGSYLRLTVKDTGAGIPEAIQERIFDPFFSTKPQGEGTGMGLAVVKGIVDSVGGAIAVESKEGEGTTFHIALPLLKAPQEDEVVEWKPGPVSGGTILFVDDEAAIARMATPVIQSLGYTPIVCTDTTKALQILKEDGARIDLLITDQVMPENSGMELTELAMRIKPGLPVILCTGFPARVELEAAAGLGVRAMLLKPVTRKELGDAIASVLAGQDLLTPRLQKETAPQPPEAEEDPADDELAPPPGNA